MDDLRRIDLNLLLSLHALLAEKHVTRAATRLHKSQPAISHSLAQLRALFQDPLLLRQGGSMVLTPHAQELMQPLQSALEQLQALVEAPRFDPARAQRRMTLALSDYAAQLLLPALMRRLRSEAPGMDLAISQGSREAMQIQLSDGEADLALGVFPDIAADIHVETLFEERFVSLADKQQLPARGGLDLAEWLRRPHVLVAMRPGAANEIDSALAAQGLRRRIALSLPHWSAAPAVLPGTDLVLTVARRSLGPLGRHSPLRSFAPPLPLPGFAFQQAWHARRDADPAHQWLRQLVRECSQ